MAKQPPTIAALCPTYNRPRLLGQAIAMFLVQDYPHKWFAALDDSGIFDSLEMPLPPKVTLLSTGQRSKSVGAKRNYLAKLTTVDYIAVWDDDDIYLPWHLSAAVEALGKRCWAQPRHALDPPRRPRR